LILEIATINDVFRKIQEHDHRAAARYRLPDGQWKELSAQDIYQRVHNTARALQSWGIGKGDRVAILSENRPGWAIADFATLLLGAVDVPVYPTLTAEQTAYILKDSGCRIAFVSTAEQIKKVVSIKAVTNVEHIVVIEDVDDPNARKLSSMMLSAPYRRDPELDAQCAAAKPDDLATIIYTSGTTGTPKGVMLTHGNIASNIVGSTAAFEWSNGDGYISFLPLSHITARHVDYLMYAQGIDISYCPAFDDLARTLREVRPHNIVAVPRVYEKIRQEAERRAGRGLSKRIFDWSIRIGMQHRDRILAGEQPDSFVWKIADKLVFSKVRAAMGGRGDCHISGGAPLGIDIAEWFAAIGVRIFEGYGLTETSPVIAINTRKHYRLGTVGRPLPNVQCKIADDGELLVKGPAVTKGYWNLPEETQRAFVDGWFCTGDIASLDVDGFLKITDRKKDLIKTSGGKFIAPQPIENALKANVLVAHAAIIGDKRKFAAVIIAPHFALLEDWARANGVNFSSRADLIHDEKVRGLYEGIVADLNSRLAHFETLKRIILVPDEFSVATGEITPSLKLKRRVVEKKYGPLVEALYAAPYQSSEHELVK
jgi:long-chain acyl-CoA synthetase